MSDTTPCEDESGVEGVAVKCRPDGQKLIVVGKRFSAESVKQQQHENKEDQLEAHQKQSRSMQVNAVDQVPWTMKLGLVGAIAIAYSLQLTAV